MTRTFTLRSFLFTQATFHSRKERNLTEFVEKSWSNIRIPLPRQFYPRLGSVRHSLGKSSSTVRIPLSAFGTIKIHGYANTVYFAADTFLFHFIRVGGANVKDGCNDATTRGHKIFVHSCTIKSPICPDYSV